MRLRLSTIISLFVLFPASTFAQITPTWSWSYPGLSGSSVRDLAFDGGLQIWAAAGPDVVHSGDGGSTWTLRHTFSAQETRSFVRLSNGDLYAALFTGELMVSTDGGFTWVEETSVGFASHIFEISPGVISVGGWDGAWRSTDGGATWSTLANAPDAEDQHWFDATTGLILGEGLIWRSTDSGATWGPIAGVFYENEGVRMDFSGAEGIINIKDDSFPDLYYSIDSGVTWTPESVAGGSSPTWMPQAGCLALGGGRFLAAAQFGFPDGYVETTDYWATSSTTTVAYPWAMAKSGSDLYVGAGGVGVYRSTDDGSTWSDLVANVGRSFTQISLAPPFGLIGSSSAIARTTDGGATWQSAVLPVGTATSLGARDATTGFVGGTAGAVGRTLDAGASWATEALPGAGSSSVVDFEFPPGDHVYARTSGSSGSVYHSAASSDTWVERAGGLPAGRIWVELEFPTATDGFVIDRDSGEIWRTSDGGLSWTLAGVLPVSVGPSPYGRFEARTASQLFAIGPTPCDVCPGDGFWRSDDGGTTWTDIVPFAGAAKLSEADGVLYITGEFGAQTISYSQNGGPSEGNLFHNLETICCAPTLPPLVVEGYRDIAVYSGGLAVLGTHGVVEIADLAIVDAPASVVDGPLSLRAVRPVGSSFEFVYRTVDTSPATLSIFDVHGRRVHEGADIIAPAGAIVDASWDGRDGEGRLVEPGVYFVELRSGSRREATRVTLIR